MGLDHTGRKEKRKAHPAPREKAGAHSCGCLRELPSHAKRSPSRLVGSFRVLCSQEDGVAGRRAFQGHPRLRGSSGSCAI